MSDQKGNLFRRWPLILGLGLGSVLALCSCRAVSSPSSSDISYYNDGLTSVDLWVDGTDVTTIDSGHTYVDRETPGTHSVSATISVVGTTVFGPVDEDYNGDSQTVKITTTF